VNQRRLDVPYLSSDYADSNWNTVYRY